MGVSAREDTLDSAREGGREGGRDEFLDEALEARLWPRGSLQLLRDAFPIRMGRISTSFGLARLVWRSFWGSSNTKSAAPLGVEEFPQRCLHEL